VHQKILDSSREFIANFNDKGSIDYLGFVDPEEDDEEDMMEELDAFIQKIATMLLSLLEGGEDIEILQKMAFSLSINDMKDRMVNVFGNFLVKIDLMPKGRLPTGEDYGSMPLSKLSKEGGGNILANVQVNKINSMLNKDSFEGNV